MYALRLWLKSPTCSATRCPSSCVRGPRIIRRSLRQIECVNIYAVDTVAAFIYGSITIFLCIKPDIEHFKSNANTSTGRISVMKSLYPESPFVSLILVSEHYPETPTNSSQPLLSGSQFVLVLSPRNKQILQLIPHYNNQPFCRPMIHSGVGVPVKFVIAYLI